MKRTKNHFSLTLIQYGAFTGLVIGFFVNLFGPEGSLIPSAIITLIFFYVIAGAAFGAFVGVLLDKLYRAESKPNYSNL
ncbi:MAG: hypothetical protein K1X86_08095 [Ignavibacteria bacterium]|nr:hypothetical protein [Ignavibacteria bacterium]